LIASPPLSCKKVKAATAKNGADAGAVCVAAEVTVTESVVGRMAASLRATVGA
jgi:hypothetical protein